MVTLRPCPSRKSSTTFVVRPTQHLHSSSGHTTGTPTTDICSSGRGCKTQPSRPVGERIIGGSSLRRIATAPSGHLRNRALTLSTRRGSQRTTTAGAESRGIAPTGIVDVVPDTGAETGDDADERSAPDALSDAASCVFCAIVARRSPARIVFESRTSLAFFPTNPATTGHTLLIPNTCQTFGLWMSQQMRICWRKYFRLCGTPCRPTSGWLQCH